MVDPHAAQAALRSRTGVCGYDAHRCSTRGKAQSCRPVSSPVDCDSLRPPASHHASHPDRHAFTRTVGDRGPVPATGRYRSRRRIIASWYGAARYVVDDQYSRSIYSQYVLSHTIFIGVQSVSSRSPRGPRLTSALRPGLSTTISNAHRVSKDGSNTVVQENR